MSRNKKILVIGAGLAQVDAIRKAKDIGYYILASDVSPEAEGLRLAHESRIIDVTDIESNLEWAKTAGIDGVISYASEITLPTVQAIRESLNLPGLGRVPMEISLDKSKQRECFKTAGLAQPEFEVVDSLNGLNWASERIGFPLVVKPIDNSGSRGVTLVQECAQLSGAFAVASEHSKKKRVIAEKFMEGTELTIEGLSINGLHHILAISDKFKPSGSYRVATQLTYPAAISTALEQQVVALLCKAYDSAHVDNTPTHSEVILTSEGPKIVEISCRGGGFYVFSRIVEAASGYDIVANWTRMCAGDVVENVRNMRKGVVLGFYAAQPGRMVCVSGLEEAQAIEGIDTGLFIKPNEIVPELRTDGSRTGWIIAKGEDRGQALMRAEQARELVTFVTEPC